MCIRDSSTRQNAGGVGVAVAVAVEYGEPAVAVAPPTPPAFCRVLSGELVGVGLADGAALVASGTSASRPPGGVGEALASLEATGSSRNVDVVSAASSLLAVMLGGKA